MNSEILEGIDEANKRNDMGFVTKDEINRSTRSRLLKRLETDKKWYYLPPYMNEGEIVADAAGQHIAVFETKELALECVETHNRCIEESK